MAEPEFGAKEQVGGYDGYGQNYDGGYDGYGQNYGGNSGLMRSGTDYGSGSVPGESRSSKSMRSIAILVLVPTVMYAIIVHAFAIKGPKVWTLSLAILLLVFGALFISRAININLELEEVTPLNSKAPTKPTQLYTVLGVLCWLAVFSGGWQGCSLNARFFRPYYGFTNRPTYTNVLPSDPASAREDAAIIGFDSQAVVDTFRAGSVSSPDLTLFCVAPIFDESGQSRAEFWAVGVDCCGKYGGFYCDDSQDMSCKSGLVIRDENSTFAPPVYDKFIEAVNATAAKYQLQIPDRPVLLRWKSNPEDLMGPYFWNGILHMFVAIAFYACISTGIGCGAAAVEGSTRKNVQMNVQNY